MDFLLILLNKTPPKCVLLTVIPTIPSYLRFDNCPSLDIEYMFLKYPIALQHYMPIPFRRWLSALVHVILTTETE